MKALFFKYNKNILYVMPLLKFSTRSKNNFEMNLNIVI